MKRRLGFSLIEILIVIAILGLLVALTVAAIQRTRMAAVRMQSENNIRQIILATHQLADMREGQIKGLTGQNLPKKPFYSEQSVFEAILPWTLGELHLPQNPTPDQIIEYMSPIVKLYMSPGDPSLHFNPALENERRKCSYAANLLAFDGIVTFPFSIPDGTSSTMAFAERYYYCEDHKTTYTYMYLDYHYIFPYKFTGTGRPYGTRRATFADRGWGDVVPATDASTGQTIASVPGKTFQVRPRIEDAEGGILQTPYMGGLPVAFFDGSVRTLSPSINESVFWSLITPNGGEVIGDY